MSDQMDMDNDARLFVKAVLDLYLALPETPTRVNRRDRALALHLFERAVPLPTIEAAFMLASARRLCRPTDAPSLGSIRSLHYFLPVIEEVISQPLPAGYLDYLKHKIVKFWPQNSSAINPRFQL